MVLVHLSWFGVIHTSVFCISGYRSASVGYKDVMRLEV